MPNNKFSQISLLDIYEDVNTSFTEKKSELVSLLEKHIDFSSLISYEFHHAFYSNIGRKHKYHLESFIKALIIQKLFAFNLDSQLILVLKNSDTLRDFCDFDKVPDGSYFTRFKQRYCDYLADMFHKLVDITEPICHEIDSKKADYLIFDTTGIEPYVAENNPKFLNTKHWDNLYNHRVYIERTIFLLKDCFGLNTLRTQNTTTIKADVYLAAITQLIGVILAKSIHELKFFKSIRKLVKQAA